MERRVWIVVGRSWRREGTREAGGAWRWRWTTCWGMGGKGRAEGAMCVRWCVCRVTTSSGRRERWGLRERWRR
eukprot:847960-Rhodomonas_salina.1